MLAGGTDEEHTTSYTISWINGYHSWGSGSAVELDQKYGLIYMKS